MYPFDDVIMPYHGVIATYREGIRKGQPGKAGVDIVGQNGEERREHDDDATDHTHLYGEPAVGIQRKALI